MLVMMDSDISAGFVVTIAVTTFVGMTVTSALVNVDPSFTVVV